MEGLNHNDLKPDQIDMLIPHQANLRISQFVQKKFGLSDDQVHNNIQKCLEKLEVIHLVLLSSC